MNWPVVQCLTIDGIALSHEAQVHALCAAGVDWIQLRMKTAGDAEVASVAAACLPYCRDKGVRLILNDRIEVALEVGVDGVHLGRLDLGWEAARDLAGPEWIIGGTVNSVEDAQRAVDSQALNYVGVGPYRFTRTKQNLAPTLRSDQWRSILKVLGDLPSYAIGGIVHEDLPKLRTMGLQGVAVSSGLFRGNVVRGNYQGYLSTWSREIQFTKELLNHETTENSR